MELEGDSAVKYNPEQLPMENSGFSSGHSCCISKDGDRDAFNFCMIIETIYEA